MPSSNVVTRSLAAALLLLLGSSVFVSESLARNDRAALPAADKTRPTDVAHWQRAELYFGLGAPGADNAADYAQRWQAFLDEEVTPRFPDGFSVLDAYGQWRRNDNGKIEHLNSKLLVILYRGSKQRGALEALRSAWKQRTGDESVLLSITHADVSF